MKTKDYIELTGECKPHRLINLGFLHKREKCHIHKKIIHQTHHVLGCQLMKCPNFKSMLKEQVKFNLAKSKYRKAVFIVVYRKEKDKILYLILKRKLHWKGWEFPKGGTEKREKLVQTLERELKEETGQSAIKIIKFNLNGK